LVLGEANFLYFDYSRGNDAINQLVQMYKMFYFNLALWLGQITTTINITQMVLDIVHTAVKSTNVKHYPAVGQTIRLYVYNVHEFAVW